jgi:hypothetical protein
MTERRSARRYDLSLPVQVIPPGTQKGVPHPGQTRDISTRGVYFVIHDKELAAGAALDFTLTLPPEITGGSQVHIRAHGHIIRVDKKPGNGLSELGVAAVIERYDILRSETHTP